MRHYRKNLRAQSEQQTRLRIVKAAVELHGTIGPARTTISDIAKRAGVQRLTVYRHFPNEKAIFAACSGHFMAQNPLPELSQFAAIAEPEARLRTALDALYAWFGRHQRMVSLVLRDAPSVPAMKQSMQAMEQYFGELNAMLMAPRRAARDKRIAAMIALATSFACWRQLSDAGLSDGEAAALMAQAVECCARAH